MSIAPNPEVGSRIRTGALETNYHDIGSGPPVLFLHGSGPGVSAWSNWRLPFAKLSNQMRCVAPDLAGFGYTPVPPQWTYSRETWLEQIVTLLDQLGIERVSVVGNSFGGAMALAMAVHYPQRVEKLVLMGSVGVSFPITRGLDLIWGYTPAPENMREVMKVFAFDQSLITEDLIAMRYEASVRPEGAAAYQAMFPEPRQRWVDALAFDDATLRKIGHETLIVHGRDDAVIPLENSLNLNKLIDRSQLHVFGRCGHWTQIEHADRFTELVGNFLRPRNSD